MILWHYFGTANKLWHEKFNSNTRDSEINSSYLSAECGTLLSNTFRELQEVFLFFLFCLFTAITCMAHFSSRWGEQSCRSKPRMPGLQPRAYERAALFIKWDPPRNPQPIGPDRSTWPKLSQWASSTWNVPELVLGDGNLGLAVSLTAGLHNLERNCQELFCSLRSGKWTAYLQ